jgi:hypothetical protein
MRQQHIKVDETNERKNRKNSTLKRVFVLKKCTVRIFIVEYLQKLVGDFTPPLIKG